MRRFILVALLGCGGAPTPSPVTPPPLDGALCDRFCGFLAQNHCPGEDGSPGQDEVRGNADDVPCARVCSDVLSKGTYQSDESCLSVANSCEAAEACVFGP